MGIGTNTLFSRKAMVLDLNKERQIGYLDSGHLEKPENSTVLGKINIDIHELHVPGLNFSQPNS